MHSTNKSSLADSVFKNMFNQKFKLIYMNPEQVSEWKAIVKAIDDLLNRGRLKGVNPDSPSKKHLKLIEDTASRLMPSPKHAESHEINSNVTTSVSDSFLSPYVGSPRLLCDTIEAIFPEKERYSNSFAIVQSSGTGKSRLVDEMAKQRFTFPLCVRESDPPGHLSFPYPDESVHNFFVGHNSAKRYRRLAALTFLCALFKCGRGFLEHINQTDTDCYERVAEQWRTYLKTSDTTRSNFYKDVTKNAQSNYHAATLKLRSSFFTEQEDKWNSSDGKKYAKIVKGLARNLKEQYLQLKNAITQLYMQLEGSSTMDASSELSTDDEHKTPVIIYFDEADNIGNLDGLTSAFADLFDYEVVGIYLSTNSGINILAPTPIMINSERNTERATLVLPFTELHLDIYANDYFKGKPSSWILARMRSIEVSASLGRAMWTAHLRTGYPIGRLLALAYRKLTGTFPGADDLESSGEYALLCSRLLVQTNMSQAGRELSALLVASHLGTMYLASKDRSMVLVGYPPEPFVSAAAAQYMVKHTDWPAWLSKMISNNLISRGNRDELISRVEWTLARDRAYTHMTWKKEKTSNLTRHSVLPGHEPVPLRDVLKFFCGVGFWDRVAGAKPINIAQDNPSCKTLSDFIGDRAAVDFTCFAVAADESIFTYRGMIKALVQGTAVVCRANQRLYDLVIVFLLDPSLPPTPGNLGLLLVQVKNTKEAKNPVLAPESLPCGTQFAIISILHRVAQSHNVTVKSSPKKGSRKKKTGEPQPQYQITVDGSDLIDENMLQALLMGDDPVACHRGTTDIAKHARAVIRKNRLYPIEAGSHPGGYDENIEF